MRKFDIKGKPEMKTKGNKREETEKESSLLQILKRKTTSSFSLNQKELGGREESRVLVVRHI